MQAHLRKWHRRTGLVAAVFVVLFVVTGVLLNHTGKLGLGEVHMRSAALLDWYGIQAPAHARSFKAGAHWVSELGERIYLNGSLVATEHSGLLGAVLLEDVLVVALEGHVMLFDAAGRRLEVLGGAEGVPSGMSAIGSHGEALIVRAGHGDYRADKDLLRWEKATVTDEATVTWARPAATPDSLYAAMAAAYRGEGLSLERVLLDLHSGRIFGRFGPLLMDAVALALLVLVLSGVWVFSHAAQRRNSLQDDAPD